MAIDLDSKATKDLETIVANCVRLNRTSDPVFDAANKILELRRTGEYNIEKTIAAIRKRGRLRTFLSYKDVADASGLNWVKSRRGVTPHLDAVCFYAAGKGWPLLSSIVVNKDKIETGEMSADNLKGFIESVRAAGVPVDIEDLAFMKREQQRVFAWCREEH
jgi:5-methylcytosine-specific restriction protein B